jgi:hypothetical protein
MNYNEKSLIAVKETLKQFTIPKYSGMSMDELSKLLYVAVTKYQLEEELADEENEMARMDAQDIMRESYDEEDAHFQMGER